jgi:RNA recognition motif-containing protein
VEDKHTRRSKGVAYVEFYETESVSKAIAVISKLINSTLVKYCLEYLL